MDESKAANIVKMRQNGVRVSVIAEAYSVTPSTIYSYIYKYRKLLESRAQKRKAT